VDKSSLGITDDVCPDLENFMTILEHIFNHRLKRKTSVLYKSDKCHYRLSLDLESI